jgi:D-glycero-beta-D-manno-heptose 1-phosphate adenylyltransferase
MSLNSNNPLFSLIQHKILHIDDIDNLRKQNINICEKLGCNTDKPLVFTNGVFDILHQGHLFYLSEAKALGYKLIVAVNSDVSTKLLNKGSDRPINHEINRQIMLACLCMVDYVIIFSEKTPLELLHKIQPHIYVKGGDYVIENLIETPAMHSWGGQVRILSFIDGYSTTNFLHKIRQYS